MNDRKTYRDRKIHPVWPSLAIVVIALLVGGILLAPGSDSPQENQGTRQAETRAQLPSQELAVQRVQAGGQLPAPKKLSAKLARAFPALSTAGRASSRSTSPADPALLAAQQNQANRDPGDDPLIDYGRAVAVPVSGGSQKAWIAPADNNRICTIIANQTGTSGSCNTLAEVARGAAITIVANDLKSEDPSFTVVNPTGTSGPRATVTDSAGRTTPLGGQTAPTQLGAFAQRLDKTATLKNGATTTKLSNLAAVAQP